MAELEFAVFMCVIGIPAFALVTLVMYGIVNKIFRDF